jgi:hypothetical protein
VQPAQPTKGSQNLKSVALETAEITSIQISIDTKNREEKKGTIILTLGAIQHKTELGAKPVTIVHTMKLTCTSLDLNCLEDRHRVKGFTGKYGFLLVKN